MKTERKNMLETLEFCHHGRVPVNKWSLPWCREKYAAEWAGIQRDFPDSLIYCGVFPQTTYPKGDPNAVGQYLDEWNCLFDNVMAGVMGEVKNPPVQDLSDFSAVRIPEELLLVDKAKVNDFCHAHDEFVLASPVPRLFERLQFLRGTENTMVDLAMEEPGLIELLDLIHRYNCREVEIWCQTDVDGVAFQDDWGSQKNLLISPDMWRQHFKPRYREFIEIAKHYHKKVFMHSDGQIADIYPDLVEIGVDAVNSQIFCMDREVLKKMAGKITFWGEMDRQFLLCRGTESQIREAVQSLKNDLYRSGGLIAQAEFGVGCTPERYRWTMDEFVKE